MDNHSKRLLTSKKSRNALLVVDGMECSWCGASLTIGWHADHIVPFCVSGETRVEGMQAMCPGCNLKKGCGMKSLREWQVKCQEAYLEYNDSNFLVEACPGSGKTVLAIEIAKRKASQGRKIIVVVPTTALRTQWANKFHESGISIDPAYSSGGFGEFDGIVVTYTAVSANPDIYRVLCGRNDVFAIFDEIHHCGDETSWGVAIRHGFELANDRLSLSGTPFRSTGDVIPFVKYVDGVSSPDFQYSYGDAVVDGSCRRVFFTSCDGEARWAIKDTEYCGTLSVPDNVPSTVNRKLRVALSCGDWFKSTFAAANNKLKEQQSIYRGAAGLVIATDIWHAQSVAKQIKEITGVGPVVVSSEDANSPKKIEDFARGSDDWIVAVKMISEGIDIPRLSVEVYATVTTSRLFFRQGTGRITRTVAGNKNQPAFLYMPADHRLIEHAVEIENEVLHSLEGLPDWKRTTAGDGESLENTLVPLGSTKTEESIIVSGNTIPKHIIAKANEIAAKTRQPFDIVVMVLMESENTDVPELSHESPSNEIPHYKVKDVLRKDNEEIGRRVANVCNMSNRDVNRALNMSVGIGSVKVATLKQLEQRKQVALEMLAQGAMSCE